VPFLIEVLIKNIIIFSEICDTILGNIMTEESIQSCYRRSIEQALLINNADIIDQVSQLAKLLAVNKSFVYEIGLDEFTEAEIIQRLQLLVAFVLAMYNAAEAILKNLKFKDLDERAIAIIGSRIGLMPVPDIIEGIISQEEYSKSCYIMHYLGLADESVKGWEDMNLSEHFFEICLCVFREEMKLDSTELRLIDLEIIEKITSRSIMGVTFKGVFSYIKWELDNIAALKKVVLYPKKSLGPVTNLREYPLLYLYFDDFNEIFISWNKGYFELWKHDSDIRSREYSREEIIQDEKLFLKLYKNNLLRLRLWDGKELFKKIEENYWDRIINPEKYTNELYYNSDSDPEIITKMKELRYEIDRELDAIKLRYGLTSFKNT
jgi:hypothetical protein